MTKPSPLTFICLLRSLARSNAWLLIVATVACVGLRQPCAAQDIFEWNNTTNSNAFYDIGGNWTPGGPPTSIDVAQFNQTATYNVFWDTLTASFSPNVGFVDVFNGSDLTLLNNDLAPQYSFTINNDLTVAGNGTQLTNAGLNLNVAGTTFLVGGSLLIDGSHPAGSQFNASGPVLAGQGAMTFDNGAVGNLAGGLDLNVDAEGAAVFNVLGGSQVTTNAIRIGNGTAQSTTSAGTLNLNGSASSLVLDGTTNFVIGNSNGLGQHVVDVTDGGLLDINLNGSAAMQVEASGALNIDNASVVHNQSGNLFSGWTENLISPMADQ